MGREKRKQNQMGIREGERSREGAKKHSKTKVNLKRDMDRSSL
jgi:hypothetical protein